MKFDYIEKPDELMIKFKEIIKTKGSKIKKVTDIFLEIVHTAVNMLALDPYIAAKLLLTIKACEKEIIEHYPDEK